jgi:hypothetical protein
LGIDGIRNELRASRTISDPARAGLLETRKAVIAAWDKIASTLEAQGNFVLGGDVRHFARHLPRVLTDRERLAEEMILHARAKKPDQRHKDVPMRDRALERTR